LESFPFFSFYYNCFFNFPKYFAIFNRDWQTDLILFNLFIVIDNVISSGHIEAASFTILEVADAKI
jgi:hypothetical protein